MMPRLMPRSSWMTFLAMVLLAVSIVHGHPLPGAEGHESELQSRSPRLIPDTANYLTDVFGTLGLLGFGKDNGNSQGEQGKPQNEPASTTSGQQQLPTVTPRLTPTPTTSSYTVSSTKTSKNDYNDDKPIENVLLMSGYSNKQGLTAEDVPVVLDAVYKTLADRFRNMVDSSDELTL